MFCLLNLIHTVIADPISDLFRLMSGQSQKDYNIFHYHCKYITVDKRFFLHFVCSEKHFIFQKNGNSRMLRIISSIIE